MFNSLKAKIIIGVISLVIVGGGIAYVVHVFREAGKVPGLEKALKDVEKEKADFQLKLNAQTEAAKNRIESNTKIADNQNTKQKDLINENAKTPSVIIPADKLRALLQADAATEY